ncbi:MAG: hypothetical protein HZA88_14620 [Verrucomicrobia bacterium]|nr:hypothetical protein [Verrucomicrobiota bacterium]
MSKKTTKKTTKRTASVKVVADGSNCVTLVFPEGPVLKGKKKLSIKDVAKVLSAVETGEVSGQCYLHAFRHRIEVRTPTAIGGVRG